MFAWCHDVMTGRHDVTKLTSPISPCRCSKVMLHMYFRRLFGCWVPSYYHVCTCMMSSCHNVTSRRHLNYYMTSRTDCFHLSLQLWSRADSISFLWFCWWLNSTWLLSSYLHDGITSQNDVMTSLNMLYLSQLVDVLTRWFFFVSIVLSVDNASYKNYNMLLLKVTS